jgi:hypothetical protein
MSEITHPKAGEIIMTTFTHVQNTRGDRQVSIGSAFKVAAAAAIVSIITVYSASQLSSVHFASTVAADFTERSDLRDVLCRIDHRCPAATRVFAHVTAR